MTYKNLYLITSNCGAKEIIAANSPRQACAMLGAKFYCSSEATINKGLNKVYQDTTDGNTFHTGYHIGNIWMTVYTLEPMRIKQ